MKNRMKIATMLKKMLIPTKNEAHRTVRRGYASMVRINLYAGYIKRRTSLDFLLCDEGQYPEDDWLFELANMVTEENSK